MMHDLHPNCGTSAGFVQMAFVEIHSPAARPHLDPAASAFSLVETDDGEEK